MTAAEYQASLRPAGQKHAAGRNAVAVDTPDGRMDSKAEARRWADLQLLARAGHISGLQRQVRIPLIGQHGPILTPSGRQMVYVADFTYAERGAQIIEDCKGHPSPVYLMKKAILKAMGKVIRETKG